MPDHRHSCDAYDSGGACDPGCPAYRQEPCQHREYDKKPRGTVGGYPSSDRPASDLAPPPKGPAPGTHAGAITVNRLDLERVVAALDAAAGAHEGVLSGTSERALINLQADLRATKGPILDADLRAIIKAVSEYRVPPTEPR